MERVKEKCDITPIVMYYFYSNEGDCPDCVKEGYVLTRLKEKYPELRVYSFDYSTQLSVIASLKAIYRIDKALPALVIEDKTYIGYKSVEELEALLPDTLKVATTTTLTATSSDKKVK